MKLSKNILLGLILSVCVISIVSASSTWSNAYTYELNSSDDWIRNTTQNEWMGNQKTSDSNIYDVYTVSKTMWTNPKFRVVNYHDVAVAKTVTTASTGKYATGKENTGVVGYSYYGSVKPAWNQAGTDRIKLQFKVY